MSANPKFLPHEIDTQVQLTQEFMDSVIKELIGFFITEELDPKAGIAEEVGTRLYVTILVAIVAFVVFTIALLCVG